MVPILVIFLIQISLKLANNFYLFIGCESGTDIISLYHPLFFHKIYYSIQHAAIKGVFKSTSSKVANFKLFYGMPKNDNIDALW